MPLETFLYSSISLAAAAGPRDADDLPLRVGAGHELELGVAGDAQDLEVVLARRRILHGDDLGVVLATDYLGHGDSLVVDAQHRALAYILQGYKQNMFKRWPSYISSKITSVSQEKIEPGMIYPQESNATKPPPPVRQCQVCGASISPCSYRRHVGAKKHWDAEYIQLEKFEVN